MSTNNFKYIQGVTSVETTLDEVWKLKAGVCQDFAQYTVWSSFARYRSGRYVSGYICRKEWNAGEGATHAWIEAYSPSMAG